MIDLARYGDRIACHWTVEYNRLDGRRFEAETKTGRKLWEIVTDPALDVLATRHGRTGTEGKVDTKRCGDPAQAANKAAKLVAAKVKQGYRETE